LVAQFTSHGLEPVLSLFLSQPGNQFLSGKWDVNLGCHFAT
jgi:hypothetical protein